MAIEKLKEGPVTYQQTKEMVDFAEECLLKYFEIFGEKRPGDLEDDFCGYPGDLECRMNPQGRWRDTPFYPALGRLVDKGTVSFEIDDDGDIWYGRSRTAPMNTPPLECLVRCDDTCYECKHYMLCFLRRKFDDAYRSGGNMLNIDGPLRPGKLTDFFKVLAASCHKFEHDSSGS